MSADNGWILRRNTRDEFVLQSYFASDEMYPPIDDPKAQVFKSLEGALGYYERHDAYTEYGLTVNILIVTEKPPAVTINMKMERDE